MAFDKKLFSVFLPDDASWLKHTNPWSIWTRFATLPFIILAIWSRVWIGWYCLIPIILLIIWVFINPTLFKAPKNFDSWGSRAVLGEQIYLNRSEKPIPKHHAFAALILTVLQSISGLILGYGLWKLDLYSTIYGASTIYLSKMWFLDRMVWLHQDTQQTRERP